ncbi:hypothetical protein C2S52_019393 [Perilla frutescens var. hirtella]|nr:hypothetical protein C2S52_019393 [Perilla frutescens var. hirtella]KAH6806331.1 hypothetical protein C2S51_031162 [Perilla frutescens var. frutescens]
MGCFPACFGHLRSNVTTKKVQDQCLSPSDEQHESVKLLPDKTESQEEEIVNPIKLISESEYKCKEQMYISNEEKPVSENSNLKKDTNELASSNSDKLVENENGEAEKESGKGKEDESGSIFSSRIQELINDNKCAAVDSKEASLEGSPVQEESCGSLFSLSIDSRKHFYAAEMGEKEVSSSPFKMNNTSSKYDEEKENAPFSKDPMIEQSFDKSKPLSDCQCKRRDCVIAVETSLSSWLVESEKSPQKLSVGSSPESEKNYGDGMILGVIASPADIKELNGSSPCCSTDDKPGIGTVGRYWRQRGLAGDGTDVGLNSCREVSV